MNLILRSCLVLIAISTPSLAAPVFEVLKGLHRLADGGVDDLFKEAKKLLVKEAASQINGPGKIAADDVQHFKVPILKKFASLGAHEWELVRVPKNDWQAVLRFSQYEADKWPAGARKTIQRAEKNSVERGWPSFANFKQAAQNVLQLQAGDEAKNAEVANQMAAEYRTDLAKWASDIAEAQQAIDALWRTERSRSEEVLKHLSEVSGNKYGIGLGMLRQTLNRAAFSSDLLRFEVAHSDSMLSATIPVRICEGWDVSSKLGFCMNRRSVLNAEIRNTRWLTDLLKPLSSRITKASGLTTLHRRMQPKEMVELSGVLENAIIRTTPDYEVRFRLLFPKVMPDPRENPQKMLATKFEDVVTLNLLPTEKAHVAAWTEYASGDRDAYVENGRRVANILKHRKATVVDLKSDQSIQSIQSQLAQLMKDGKVLVIVGEANDEKTIRMPGDGLLSIEELRKAIPVNTPIVGLYCGSETSLTQAPGLAVRGKLKGTEAVDILKLVLGQVPGGSPETVAEFLNDWLIFASHRKGTLVTVGSLSVGLTFARREKEPAPKLDSKPASSIAPTTK